MNNPILITKGLNTGYLNPLKFCFFRSTLTYSIIMIFTVAILPDCSYPQKRSVQIEIQNKDDKNLQPKKSARSESHLLELITKVELTQIQKKGYQDTLIKSDNLHLDKTEQLDRWQSDYLVKVFEVLKVEEISNFEKLSQEAESEGSGEEELQSSDMKPSKGDTLALFGYEMFNLPPNRLKLLESEPVDPNYTMGPGD